MNRRSNLAGSNIAGQRSASAQHDRRRGGTLVVGVLVCLLVARIVGRCNDSCRDFAGDAAFGWSIKCVKQNCLLDAGILRAAKQLRLSDDYTGETWRPSRDSVGFDSPVVEIQVTSGSESETRNVEVVAELGAPLSDLQPPMCHTLAAVTPFPFR